MANVKKCVLMKAKSKTVYELLEKDKAAIIRKTGGGESAGGEKTAGIEALQNLDVFFAEAECRSWSGLRYDSSDWDYTLTVEYDDGNTYSVSSSASLPDEKLFSELEKYFERYISGEIKPAVFKFHSFDGGGPLYDVDTEIKGIVTWYYKKQYMNPNHGKMCGSGYDVEFSFYPLREGKASVLITGKSPICPKKVKHIFFCVDSDFNIAYEVRNESDEPITNSDMNEDGLNGAWEEPGVIGVRIEISEPDLLYLWRNSPALETKFKKSFEDGDVVLNLDKTGLRNTPGEEPYAEITEIRINGGNMNIKEEYKIAGASELVLRRTKNSRYGNYRIRDDLLSEIQGEWTGGEYHDLSVNGDVLTLGYEKRKVKIHLLEANSKYSDNMIFEIRDADPSKYTFGEYGRLEYIRSSRQIVGYMFICDGPTAIIRFEKKEK